METVTYMLIFENGIVAAFNAEGEQVPKAQGNPIKAWLKQLYLTGVIDDDTMIESSGLTLLGPGRYSCRAKDLHLD